MAANITDLPPELLAYLFSFLHGKHLSAVALTCKLFNSAVEIDSVWKRRCLKEFNVHVIDTSLMSYKEAYTKLLYHYGYLLGPWQAKIRHYGGLLHIKLLGNKIEATEYFAPRDPHIDQPLRPRCLFTIQPDEQGNVMCVCHRRDQNDPHPAKVIKVIDNEDENEMSFQYICSKDSYHGHYSYPNNPRTLHLNETVIEWLREETGDPNLDTADLHRREMVLMRFIVLLEYECNIQFGRLKLPQSPPYSVPIEPGMFKGTYGQHGVELILLQYTEDKLVEGIKITGDPNVPAGKVTFRADLNRTMILNHEQQRNMSLLQDIDTPDLSPDISLDRLPDQPFIVPEDCVERYKCTLTRCKYRCHSQGQIAGHGYMNSSFIPGHWIVFDENTFGHMWIDLYSLSIFSRITEDLPG